jgi:7-cyano-7-deazaguanine synthase in queuosine biosynthesis
VSTDVSDEHAASILSTEEYATQVTSKEGFFLAACFAYSSALLIKSCSSETSVEFQRTTRCYISENGTAQSVERRATGWTAGVRFPTGPENILFATETRPALCS